MYTEKIVIALIVVAVIAAGMAYFQYKTNFYWKCVARSKWKKLQPDIVKIREIHDRTTGAGKKINWIEKNVTKSVKKDFDRSKDVYLQYVEFCKEKYVPFPEQHEELEALLDITEDALLNPSQELDKELERTGKEYDELYEIVSTAGEKLLSQREDAVCMIEQAEALVNSIALHPRSFEADIHESSIQKEQFKNTLEFGVEQRKALKLSAKSAGVGAAAGVAVASMAPTAAMWVATTFGTASTGTAISALSGAVSTNTAVAWLGGGALAAGGGGMAAGQALLALAGPVGWGVAGASVLTSVLFMWRKKMKIQESKKDEIARMKKCVEALKEIAGKIEAISIKTEELNGSLKRMIVLCSDLESCDYITFSENQKKMLGAMVNSTKALSELLNKTVAS